MPDDLLNAEVPGGAGGPGDGDPVDGAGAAVVAVNPVAETPEPAADPAPRTPTWQEMLEEADARDLRRHPRVAGIIGSEIQRAVQSEMRRIQDGQTQQVRAQTEAELLRFSDENAEYMREHYPRAYEHLMGLQRQRADREVQGMRGQTRNELATAIGRSFQELPEWREVLEQDGETLARAVQGKGDDEVLPHFNRAALELVANRRAQRLLAEWRETEMTAAREAIRQEEAAKLLATSAAPDTSPPKGAPATVNVAGMSDAEFDEYYRRRFRR